MDALKSKTENFLNQQVKKQTLAEYFVSDNMNKIFQEVSSKVLITIIL